MKTAPRTLLPLAAAACILGASMAPASALAQSRSRSPCPADWEKEICQLADLTDYIKQNYVNSINVPLFLQEGIKRTVSALDTHSHYQDEEEVKASTETRQNNYVGIGILVSADSGGLRIKEVFEGSSADQAGIQVGDLITQIDGIVLRNMPFKEATNLIKGSNGGQVQLLLQRYPYAGPLHLNVPRASITPARVKYKLFPSGYGWARVPSFNEKSLGQLIAAIEDLQKQAQAQNGGLKGLVLDLRDNGGGMLQSAIGIAALFLPADAAITQVIDRDGRPDSQSRTYRARFSDYQHSSTQTEDPLANLSPSYKTMPLALLINGRSASASELVSAALQEHGRAQVYGSNSFGKGSVQVTRYLPNQGAITLTTAHYFSPSGKPIDGWGVTPNIAVSPDTGDSTPDALQLREVDIVPGKFILNQDPALSTIRTLREHERSRIAYEKSGQKHGQSVKLRPEEKTPYAEAKDSVLHKTMQLFAKAVQSSPTQTSK